MERCTELIEEHYRHTVRDIKPSWLEDQTDDCYKCILNLPEKFQTTYLIVVLHNQVLNGGFHQYFINSYGQFSLQTIEALKHIGVRSSSILLTRALDVINSEKLPYDKFRKILRNDNNDSLFINDQLDLYLDSLTDEYINLQENMKNLLCSYLDS